MSQWTKNGQNYVYDILFSKMGAQKIAWIMNLRPYQVTASSFKLLNSAWIPQEPTKILRSKKKKKKILGILSIKQRWSQQVEKEIKAELDQLEATHLLCNVKRLFPQASNRTPQRNVSELTLSPGKGFVDLVRTYNVATK